MKATQETVIVRLQSENPLETEALLSMHPWLPRATGLMRDNSRALDIYPSEAQSVCAATVNAPIAEWLAREICQALQPWID